MIVGIVAIGRFECKPQTQDMVVKNSYEALPAGPEKLAITNTCEALGWTRIVHLFEAKPWGRFQLIPKSARVSKSKVLSKAQEGSNPRNYRVISISLYADQASLVDETVEALLSAGFVKANRSLVIQTAIQHLRDELRGKNPGEIVEYLLKHQVRRPLARAPRRRPQHTLPFQ